jgi:hypothetical protein
VYQRPKHELEATPESKVKDDSEVSDKKKKKKRKRGKADCLIF